MSMGVWGWWAFDIFTLIGSYMSVSVVAAQTALRSLGLITFMVPAGFSTACNVLTGNAIGERRKDKALRYYKTSLILSLAIAGLQVLILVTFRSYIISGFTSADDVAH